MAVLTGTAGNDNLTCTEDPDTIGGLDGNDQIFGQGGNDSLYGNDGDDTLTDDSGISRLHGGAGADRLDASGSLVALLYSNSESVLGPTDSGAEADVLIGSDGDDQFDAGYNDTITGGLGADVLSLNLQGAASGVVMDFTPLPTGGTVANGTGTISSIERVNVLASQHDDTIVAFSSNVGFPPAGISLDGSAGNDTLAAGSGSDQMWGGSGADWIHGGDGNDVIRSGANTPGSSPSILLDDTFEVDRLFGDAGNDVLDGGVGDFVDGGSGDDLLSLNLTMATTGVNLTLAQASTASGQTLYGATLSNIEGVMNLLLPNFANTVSLAAQSIGGGSFSADTFVFEAGSGQDVIGDFHHGEDKIQLIGSYTSFAQVSAAFVQNGADGAIDLGGGNLIVLQGVQMSTLTASDFIFG